MFKNSGISNNILKYGFAEAFSATDEYPAWNFSLYENVLKQLRENNLSVVFKPSSNKNDKFSKVSPHYKAKYNILNPGKDKNNMYSDICHVLHARNFIV